MRWITARTFSLISWEWCSECSLSRNILCCSELARRHVSHVDKVQDEMPVRGEQQPEMQPVSQLEGMSHDSFAMSQKAPRMPRCWYTSKSQQSRKATPSLCDRLIDSQAVSTCRVCILQSMHPPFLIEPLKDTATSAFPETKWASPVLCPNSGLHPPPFLKAADKISNFEGCRP